jgi:hypothetical protein
LERERRAFPLGAAFSLLSVLSVVNIALPAEPPPEPRNPVVPAMRAGTPPRIDGALEPGEWDAAPVVRGLWHELSPAPEPTEVRCCYDGAFLYFAFDCADSQPGAIRAQQRKRNGSMDEDDTVTAGIDALADRRSMYWFTVNPLGTQTEEIPGGAAAKIEWRGDWQAAARPTERGWTAEMAIPFSLLRYPPAQSRFGLIFRRRLSRLNQEWSWPIRCNYYTRDNQACWEPLEAPTIRRPPLVMPYALFGAGPNLSNSAGVDIKYQTPTNVTGLLAVRPDFQTIEDVIDTVDFSYNPRRLADRRPFFTEGAGYFGDSRMFYSRTIGEIDAGLKAFGKLGRLSFGAMNAARIGDQNSAMLTGRYDTSRYSDVGFAMVDHRADGGGNTVLKLHGSWWKPMRTNSFWVTGAILHSMTSGAPGGEGTMVTMGLDRWQGWGELGWHLYYRQIPKEFNPALGYVPEKGIRGVDGWLDYGRETKKGPLLNWSTSLSYDYTERMDGGLFNRSLEPGFGLQFRNGMSFDTGYEWRDRPPHHDRVVRLGFGWNTRDIYRSGRVGLRLGRVASGDYRFLSAGQGFKLSDALSLRLSAEHLTLDFDNPAESDEKQNQIVLTGIYDLTHERGIALRAVARDAGFNFYAAYRQEVRRGADIFLILGDPNADRLKARIALKMVNTY